MLHRLERKTQKLSGNASINLNLETKNLVTILCFEIPQVKYCITIMLSTNTKPLQVSAHFKFRDMNDRATSPKKELIGGRLKTSGIVERMSLMQFKD